MNILKVTIISLLLLISLRTYITSPPLLQDVSFSQRIFDENGRLLRMTLSEDEKYRIHTRLDQISPAFVEATLLQEDRYFFYHPGINPAAILKAIWHTYFLQKRQIGASTITMQLARIRYGISSKTIGGKILQLIMALQLELFYSKNEILEAYLNLASYGGNIEGIGAASNIYFGKSPNELNLPEALGLSVIPQNPNCRRPDPINRNALQRARAQLYQRWLALHPEDLTLEDLMQLPLQLNKKALPFLAPHYVEQVLTHHSADFIKGTLNLPLQAIVEKITGQYLEQQGQYQVHNAAVMLLDTRDMGIKALMGSADYFNRNICGHINGTKVKRSPGSTLKPFIYALALDQGLIHPFTVLNDAPCNFSDYCPENCDRDFLGPLRAKDALILSRNLPAISLAVQLKNPTLYDFLKQAKVSRLRPESSYGLSLVLGGAELTMQELATLYAMLANQGVWQPVRDVLQDNTPPVQLLSPEACFLTLDMLRDTLKPYTANAFVNNQIPVYWKTGTSSAYRDAWTVGIFGPYVLTVWIGNFDSTSNPSFIGASTASPLFFQIISALSQTSGSLPEVVQQTKDMNLTKIEVCATSGLLPTPYCPHTVSTWFIPGKSPIKRDTVHRKMARNSVNDSKSPQAEQEHYEVYECWPSDILNIFTQAGFARMTPPQQCMKAPLQCSVQGQPPQILSPLQRASYAMPLNKTLSPILFTAAVDADVKWVFWFLNQHYIGKSDRDQALEWQPKVGSYTVLAVDDHGRSAVGSLEVEMVGRF